MCQKKIVLLRPQYVDCRSTLFRNRVQRYYKKMKNTNYFVKKLLSYWILFPVLLFSGHVNAEVEVNNYVGAFATLGEWSLLPQGNSKYALSLGVSGGLGGVYEMRLGPKYCPTAFLLDIGVGVSGGMTSYMQSSNMTETLTGQTSISGKTFDYVYEVNDRSDQYRDIALGVPFMFGVQHKKFYMLAGMKLYYHFFTKTASTATVNTYGVFEGLDDFRNMPEYQFFEGVNLSGGVKTHFSIDLDASLEIGGRFGYYTDATGFDIPKNRIEYRLAAFVDYGLFDIRRSDMKNVNADALSTPDAYDATYNATTMIDNLVMSDVMSVEGFSNCVNNLMVGLKFTVLFQLPKTGDCILCRDNYRSSAKSGGSRSGVKYEE